MYKTTWNTALDSSSYWVTPWSTCVLSSVLLSIMLVDCVDGLWPSCGRNQIVLWFLPLTLLWSHICLYSPLNFFTVSRHWVAVQIILRFASLDEIVPNITFFGVEPSSCFWISLSPKISKGHRTSLYVIGAKYVIYHHHGIDTRKEFIHWPPYLRAHIAQYGGPEHAPTRTALLATSPVGSSTGNTDHLCNVRGTSYIYLGDLLEQDSCRGTLPTVLSRISTPLTASAWEHHLHYHPDRAFTDYLLCGLQQCQCLSPCNHKWVQDILVVVYTYLGNEVSLDRVVHFHRDSVPESSRSPQHKHTTKMFT